MHSPFAQVTSTPALTCTPVVCRVTCAREVVDGLLREPTALRGDEVDALLDLRSLLRRRLDAAGALALFCRLRRAMEDRFYLPFYRLRRWFENQVQVTVRVRPEEPERMADLKLDRYCIEAVQWLCLQSVVAPGEAVSAPHVQFSFRPVHQTEVAPPEGCSMCDRRREP